VGIGWGSLRLRKSRGAEHGPYNQTPSKAIAHGSPSTALRRPVHCPVIGKPIGSRAAVCVDWLEPGNRDVIVAWGRLHLREQPVADVIDAELAVIDLAV